jgi:uncharacterized protein YcbK (DUF882 family)
LLLGAAAVGSAAIGTPSIGFGAPMLPSPRGAADGRASVHMFHLHTREKLDLILAPAPEERPGLFATLNRFLRDHYSGVQGRIDPGLLDQLRSLQALLGGRTVEVISGYRSPETNERLRRRGGGVASRSLHLEGRALDLRMPGVPLATLRDAALELRAGGVGFYPTSNFVHIDTGRVRRWG